MTEDRAPYHAIERTLRFDAGPERVWAALTDPDELASWFPEFVEGITGEAGTEGWIGWEAHGRYSIRVEASEPHRRLVWRWARVPGVHVDEIYNTVVEWRLEPGEGGGTTLHLRESRFRKPEDHAENTAGWTEELAELEAYLA